MTNRFLIFFMVIGVGHFCNGFSISFYNKSNFDLACLGNKYLAFPLVNKSITVSNTEPKYLLVQFFK